MSTKILTCLFIAAAIGWGALTFVEADIGTQVLRLCLALVNAFAAGVSSMVKD